MIRTGISGAAAVALATMLAAGGAQAAAAFTPIPSYIDPGGGVTNVLGINNAGWMTGSVTEPGGTVVQGFVRDAAGAYTIFNVNTQTVGRAIDETNRVSGYALDSTGNFFTGQEFVRSAGGGVTILQNGGTDLHGIAQGMNSSGEIVGDFLTGVGNHRDGFILDGATFTDLSLPGENVRGRAITDAGDIAGWVTPTAGGPSQGFLLIGGVYTFFNAPGAVNGTFFEDLNNNGLVAGDYQDAAGDFHAFRFDTLTNTYLNLDVAGATNTQTFGLDDAGRVVLTTDLTGGPNNFLWSPGVPEPAQWVLMLTGFTLAGAALRRRRAALA